MFLFTHNSADHDIFDAAILTLYHCIADSTYLPNTMDPTVFPVPTAEDIPSIYSYNTTNATPVPTPTIHINSLDMLSNNSLANDTLEHIQNTHEPELVPAGAVIGIIMCLFASFLVAVSVIIKKQTLRQLKVSLISNYILVMWSSISISKYRLFLVVSVSISYF